MLASSDTPPPLPPPWTIEEINDACFIVRDKNGQQLGYFYYEQEPGRRGGKSADQGRGAAASGQLRQAAGALRKQ